jgi:hypothetical protein
MCKTSWSFQVRLNKGKGRVHPTAGHEGPEGEQRYSSTPSLNSALEGVGGQCHGPATLPLANTWYPNLAPPRFDPQNTLSVVSFYTNYAILAHR